MEPKQRLAYATEIADFYRMQIVAKKILSRGQSGKVGRVSGNKTFFFGLIKFRDYDGDLVHLSELTSTNRNCGIRKYFFRIRLVFGSSCVWFAD